MQELNLDEVNKLLNFINQNVDKIRFNLGIERAGGELQKEALEKVHVDPQWLTETCYLLTKMSVPKDRWFEFIKSLPAKASQYNNTLTGKQYAWFEEVHSKLLGEKPDQTKKPTPAPTVPTSKLSEVF